jgi:DNA (cytosine-5)-methyltransferase 1
MAVVETMADPGPRRAAVEKLARIVTALRTDPEGWEGSKWRDTACLSTLSRKWMDLLAFDGTGLVPTPNVLRVTARLTGTDVDRQNQMSAGRMELAKIVGDGAEAATVNAAMHRLGMQICHADSPTCTVCPLRSLCRSAEC